MTVRVVAASNQAGSLNDRLGAIAGRPGSRPSAGARGRRTTKRLPRPGSLSAVIVPLFVAAMCRATAIPPRPTRRAAQASGPPWSDPDAGPAHGRRGVPVQVLDDRPGRHPGSASVEVRAYLRWRPREPPELPGPLNRPGIGRSCAGPHPAPDLPGDAGDGDARELPGHAVLDLVVDLGQDALDVQAARAFGVGLAAVEGEELVLGLDGAEDVQERDPLGVDQERPAAADARLRTRRCRRRGASRAGGGSPPGWCSRCRR